GQIKTYDYLQKGDFFGEMALLDKSRRSANALSIEDSRLFITTHDDFQEFLINQPKILLTITKTLCQRLRKADTEIEMFSFKKVEDRLVACLLNMAEKYGEEYSEGIRISKDFTHQDFSELVGTAREVVTRILNSLKQEKLIDTQKHNIIIPSITELKKKIAE
ncbi:Crp/Fnr family transcriptional regulator, partial [Elusimicrobiota bacterium]